MPAVASTSAFVDVLRKQPFLTAPQQAELLRNLQTRFPEPRELARHLLERGWLSSYQVNQILLGNAADLVLGPYVLLERLGEGGAGQVFKARHVPTGGISALKMIRKDLLTETDIVQRFRREVHLASQLSHPNVVRSADGSAIGLGHVLVMEFVEGTDLARLVERSGPLPVAQACDYIRQAALGLQHIADTGLVHRDIKPSNLIVTRSVGGRLGGVVKVADLGLARLQEPKDDNPVSYVTATSTIMMGTVDFMSPEQAQDFRAVDIRADIYGLGCAFFFALTGQPPFPQGTPAHKLILHQMKEPPPLSRFRRDVPPGVEAVLRRMMAKLPAERFQKPGEVAQALAGSAAAGPPPLAIPLGAGASSSATVRYAVLPGVGTSASPAQQTPIVHSDVLEPDGCRARPLRGHRSRLLAVLALGLISLSALLWWVLR